MPGPDYNPSRIELRQAGKLAKTSYVNEVADALNNLSPSYQTGIEDGDRTAGFSFLAKVVTAGPAGEPDLTGEMYWLEPQLTEDDPVVDAPQFTDDHSLTPLTIIPASNLYHRTASGGAGGHWLRAGAMVRVFAEIDAAGKVRYNFDKGPDNPTFRVDLTQTGGASGSPTVDCTFTYTVKREGSSDVLGTSKAPECSRVRAFKCTVVAGTKGSAYYDHNGDLQLFECNETTTLTSKTFVTSVVCNGDGTITVMTDTAYVVA